MCGIIGYVGARDCLPILIEGLRRMEYRGYDSAGVTVINGRGALETIKRPGKLQNLESALTEAGLSGVTGIGHTRWATHGPPNQPNAHPHTSADGEISLVHNGIIENADGIRARLQSLGYEFTSDTDTEVVAHLIDEAFKETDSLERAVEIALLQIRGAYGIAVMSARDPHKLVAARNGSPLLLGIGEDGENFVASDVASILSHTRDVVYLDDGDFAVITPEGYQVFHLEAGAVNRGVSTVGWDLSEVEKGGYEHFMMKEIMEQPETIRNVLRGRLREDEGMAHLGGVTLSDVELRRIKKIIITACGTSWHAALIGEYLLEDVARIPVEVEYASELRYRNPVIEPDTLVIAISQSGETADTLAALREVKARGALTMGIVNVVGSSVARETDFGVYLHAGPEIGVASTKAFTSQIGALLLLTLYMARRRDMSVLQGREWVHALQALPDQVDQVLAQNDRIRSLAQKYVGSNNALYLGRGYQFPVALEGALKLKEVSYIHAEGYPAAEMKHGPIALIDEHMPVVVLAPHDAVYEKVVSNIEEVRARKGRVLAVVTEGNGALDGKVDDLIAVPATLPQLLPILTTIPLQLLAYHMAVLRGTDVDMPRNLAKSVTVE